MHIHEAVAKAMETDGLIYRIEARGNCDNDVFGAIKPTNTYDMCDLVVFRDGKIERGSRAWNPTANDLMADDWEVLGMIGGKQIMSEMSRKEVWIKEKVYANLESMGATEEVIDKMEELLDRAKGVKLRDFTDFAAKMSEYAVTIFILSETTGYTAEQLWDIWVNDVKNFVEGVSADETLEEEWESFVTITHERDW